VGVLAVAGTLGYWGWRLVKESKHHSAAVDFTRASTVEELKKAASEHTGQTGAGSALILAAEKQFSEGRSTDAVATLKDFLSKYPEHPLRDLASWRLAEYLAAAGDTVAAEKEYEAVGQSNSPFTGLALLRLGDLKWGAGDKEKAQEYYDKILKNPNLTGNPARDEAQQRIDKTLKMKPPTLVEYVAPLLPPPKLNTSGEPSPGSFNRPDFQFPPGLQFDDVPGGNPNSLSPFDEPAPEIPIPPPPTPPPAEESKDNNKTTTDPGKPATGGQP
jgi:predicted negative regulator of RcsB-dependent stress response